MSLPYAQEQSMSRQWLVGGLTIGLALFALLAPIPLKAAPQERHVTVAARSFAFEPGTLRVNRGDKVVIDLESSDVAHGLCIDGYGVSAKAEPGRPAQLTFIANRSGAFRFRCNVTCGNLHPFMIGKLVVGPNLTWLRALAATLFTALGATFFFWRGSSSTPESRQRSR